MKNNSKSNSSFKKPKPKEINSQEENISLLSSNNEWPKITVITPSYNQGLYIEETITSVLDQNYPNLEYIIIDGGSTDSSVSLIKKYEKHLAYWVSEKDSGQSNAINKGILKSTGTIIAWLNSDDFYRPNALINIALAYINNPTNNSCVGKTCTFYSTKKVSSHPIQDILKETAEKTAGFGGMSQPAMSFNAFEYKKIGLLNEALHYCMDLEWWIKYLLTYGINKISRLDKILVNFRIHEQSKTHNEQKHFLIERESIYYSIAIQSNQHKIAEALSKMGNIDKNYHFSFNFDKRTIRLSEKILAYYLLQRGDECYVKDENKSAAIYFYHIQEKLLPSNDKKYLRMLKLKNKFLPKFIKNLK